MPYSRFLHPNPDDAKEVPGGFLTDINPVCRYLFRLGSADSMYAFCLEFVDDRFECPR